MLVFLEEFFDISRHRNVDSARIVVPMQFDAAIEIARPILGKFIFFFDAFYQVINVFPAHILNPEVIDYQREGDRAGKMSPEARGMFTFVIPMGEETFSE
jgi:hypothetical protein